MQEIIYEGSVTHLNRYLESIAYASFRLAAIEKAVTGLTTVGEIKRVLPHSTLMNKRKRKPPAPPMPVNLRAC